MKVGHIPEITGPELPRHRATPEARSGAVAVDGKDASDKLALGQISKLAQDASEDIRPDKVASVKAAIEDGSFKIDPGTVATRIINETASLLEVLSGMTNQDSQSGAGKGDPTQQNSQENFGAGPANRRSSNPDS